MRVEEMSREIAADAQPTAAVARAESQALRDALATIRLANGNAEE